MDAILIVDDEKSICDLLSIVLKEDGYDVQVANNGKVAVKLIKENEFSAVVTDIKMPHANGISVLEMVNKTSPNTPVIMMTAYASADTAVEAMKKGAYDYVAKPFNVEDLQLIIKNAVEKKRLSDENALLKTALKAKYQFGNLIGKSQAMNKVFDYISKVSSSNATILITGESGTGKELVAQAIHYNGTRRNYPFVSINCGAMPENLLESELFGYEKGAFTSADSAKVGLMETAHKGSFFLDEIYETPQTIQVKLLRVLQEKEFTRVGGTKPIKVDLRIIAATNKDLGEGVAENKFRKDLFYRLNVIPINIPPLRERKEDIPQLANHFIDKYNDQHGRETQIAGIHPDALKMLQEYNWPGNVRELENAIERAVVLEMKDLVHPSSLPEEIQGVVDSKVPVFDSYSNEPIDLEKTLAQIEKNILESALKKTGGMINNAAKMLNLSFRSMRYRIKKHELKGKRQANENNEIDEENESP